MSDTAWHLIQYTRDPRRKEPRNIGIAVEQSGTWALRLIGLSGLRYVGGTELRQFGLSRDPFEEWADYYVDQIISGRMDRVIDAQRRRPTSFRVVSGGYISTTEALDAVADRLFRELVDVKERKSEDHGKVLRTKVESVFSRAALTPQVDVHVPAQWRSTGVEDAPDDDVPFDYAYRNGQLHLMDRLQLHQSNVEHARMIARDFHSRVLGARAAGASQSFIAFYSGSALTAIGDGVLIPAWKVARAIDVDDPTDAVQQLAAIFH